MKMLGIVGLIAVIAAQVTKGQGTTYLSNLEQPSSGSYPVGTDQWFGERFRTGPNTGGYLLNSIQLAMQNASGSPTGFTLMVYTGVGFAAPLPGSSIGSLSGTPSPMTAGVYTYTPTQDLILSPATGYFIVRRDRHQ